MMLLMFILVVYNCPDDHFYSTAGSTLKLNADKTGVIIIGTERRFHCSTDREVLGNSLFFNV